jgi:hypothetical protein
VAFLHEDLDITNNRMKPVRFQLEIAFRSDFADISEVKSGHIVRRGQITTEWSEQRQCLRTAYSNRDFHRAVATLVAQALRVQSSTLPMVGHRAPRARAEGSGPPDGAGHVDGMGHPNAICRPPGV